MRHIDKRPRSSRAAPSSRPRGAGRIAMQIVRRGLITGKAWASTPQALKPETTQTLVQMSRDLYPHDRLADSLLRGGGRRPRPGGGERTPRSGDMLEAGVAELDTAAQTAHSVQLHRPAAGSASEPPFSRRIELSPFVQKVRGNLVDRPLQQQGGLAALRLRGRVGLAGRLHQSRLQRSRLALRPEGGQRHGRAICTWTTISVVVIVGSGAGGGTLGAELALKGVKTGHPRSGRPARDRGFQNDEWGASGRSPGSTSAPRRAAGGVAKDFPNLPAWIVKAVGGSTIHWAGASLRFQEHEFKAKTHYGDVAGANLLDWPIDLAEMDPWYDNGRGPSMGVTRTQRHSRACPATTISRCLEAGAKKLGYKEVHTGRMAINSSRATGAAPASRSASASRAASRAPNGRRSMPRSRRARPPAISKCGRTARC